MRLIAASILAPLDIAFAILVILEFGFLEFRIVGASDALQRKIIASSSFLLLCTASGSLINKLHCDNC